MVKAAYDLYMTKFRWKEPPYEYVYDRNPFDVIAGTSSIREAIERGDSLDVMQENWAGACGEFMTVRDQYLLY
jgi:uncharacterized protein YbbC (DUF1343 family)